MTQDQCLSAPSNYTRYGVCYVGSNASFQLHGLTMGGAPSVGGTAATSVTEPETAALLALALVLGAVLQRGAFRSSQG